MRGKGASAGAQGGASRVRQRGPRRNKTASVFDKSRERLEQAASQDEADRQLGFAPLDEGEKRTGWLLNIASCSTESEEGSRELSGLNLYLLSQEGEFFKAKVQYYPYFYVATKDGSEAEVEAVIRRRFEDRIAETQIEEKEDLDKPNHLTGLKQRYLKLRFFSVHELMEVRRELMPIIKSNQEKQQNAGAYQDVFEDEKENKDGARFDELLGNLTDIREYDVPYHMRYCIDNDLRCGCWYDVMDRFGMIELKKRDDLLANGDVLVCAFDIETTKSPLQLPNSEYDQIFMISYMMDGEGFLITNREVVSDDIEGFEYTPKPDFQGPFTVFNERDECALLRKFFDHMQERRPGIYVTFNGDNFDFPFVETRAKAHGMSMRDEIGFECDSSGECHSRACVHMDALAWVNRDSYLPQARSHQSGSRGLKAVTKAKLGFNPIEIEPEKMQPYAREKPQEMASYSVSDALCTYYLYLKYVHPFIFALCTIVPLAPDEVLRKGTGTLCEALLMVQAFRGNIICPNKATTPNEKWYNNRLLESETYIGGHVEALESGIYRSDLETTFHCDPQAYQQLIDQLDADLQYGIEIEHGESVDKVADYEEVKSEIRRKLEALRDEPTLKERPLIYHLDVSAMYPNIILTNRLQPPSIVNDEVCAACDYNKPGANCLRKMEWKWRGQMYAARRSDYITIKNQLQAERFPPDSNGGDSRRFDQLTEEEKESYLKKRLQSYSQSVYKRVHDPPITENRTAYVCMRENPFYVNTVRDFRNRRYEYKGKVKEWKGKYNKAAESGNALEMKEAEEMCILYDSLQLAHKCILNSFYGYVMRKGARWYSMEMAGVVTHVGAKLIQEARELVDRLGTPLELDTDGIWCMLPASFPETFQVTLQNGKKLKINYPCIVLNHMVSERNRNDQYMEWNDTAGRHESKSTMTIEFEVDGPYKAMVLPAAQEEGKAIKKRYAVFTFDGTLAELKGFEMKRRGELKLIKEFQTEVFDYFLEGDTLEEAYGAVANIADRWLDMLENEGADLSDEELLEYITESSTMSKSVEEYGDRKSCATTTARRLGELLGKDFIKDRGLNCQYVISAKPSQAPVSERAIPTVVFQTDPSISRKFLRQWTKETPPGNPDELPDMRHVLDWEYYKSRLSNAIQKIVTIPAALQKVANPVPRVAHPEWIGRRVAEKEDERKQQKVDDMFRNYRPEQRTLRQHPEGDDNGARTMDVEDAGMRSNDTRGIPRASYVRRPDTQKHIKQASDSRCQHQRRGTQQHENQEEKEEEEEALRVCPDRKEDFHGWLRFQKRKWREFRRKRKAQRASNNDQDVAPANGVEGLFRRQEQVAMTSSLHIVQIVATDVPGEFIMWALVGRSLYSIPLQVPRKLYINQRKLDAEGETGTSGKRRVSKLLPHGRQPYFLYEVSIPERDFKSQGGVVLALSSGRDIEGLYESNMPLDFDAILRLGCTAAIRKEAQRKSMGYGFSVDELEAKGSAASNYLVSGNGRPAMWHIGAEMLASNSNQGYFPRKCGQGRKASCSLVAGVYICVSREEKKGICAVHIPASSVVTLVVLTEGEMDLREGHCETVWEQVAAQEQLSEMTHAEEMQFELEVCDNHADFYGTLRGVLERYLASNHGPTVALVESNVSTESVFGKALAIRQLPVVNVPFYAGDEQFPSIGWQMPALKKAISRCGSLAKWLRERIDVSRWAHIPIGNFESDWVLHAADVFFGRSLRDSDQVLWVDKDCSPDLGVGQAPHEEARLLASILDDEMGTNAQQAALPEEVSKPGSYRSVCVELRLDHLAVCAIDNASYLNEMEEFSLLGAESASVAGTEQAAVHAFKVLQGMVSSWLQCAVHEGNQYADALLYQLHRWLSSQSSKLQDPALHHIVTLCMRKIFSLLLSELKKLGAYIVRADFGHIWICTGKKDPHQAKNYVDFLRGTLGNRKLFRWLSLCPLRYWHCLLYRDKYNFSSIKLDLEKPTVKANEAANVCLTADWDIANFLPPVLKPHFEAIVSEFLFKPWQHELAKKEEETAVGDQESLTQASATTPQKSDKEREEEEEEFVNNMVQGHMTEKLLHMIKDIQRHLYQGSEAPEDHQFPKRAGSHLSEKQMGGPSVAFTKFVCHVLSLDRRSQESVKVMRKNLLKALHVHEFAPEAQFEEPCLSYVLRGVICSYCNDSRDIDICRDAEINGPGSQGARWRCANPRCRQPYNLDEIEAMLTNRLRWRAKAYQLQDLRCERCSQVKSSHVASACECGGDFHVTVSPESFRRVAKIFERVGEYHGFELLRQTAQWLRS